MEAGIILSVIIIATLEVFRYFRANKRLITEVEELKDRVKYLEDMIKEN